MLASRRLAFVLLLCVVALLAFVARRVAGDVHTATYLGNKICLACHLALEKEEMQAYQQSPHAAAKPAPGAQGASLYRYVTGLKDDGTFANAGVGCETCHGPGSDHMKDVKDKSALVNPKNLPQTKPAMVCGQCHATGKTKDGLDYPKGFRPGDDLSALLTLDQGASGKFAAFNEWQTSVHATSGVLCITCHDPHGGGDKMLRKQGDALCLDCHVEQGGGKGKPCSTPPAEREGKSCAACHMPKGKHTFTY